MIMKMIEMNFFLLTLFILESSDTTVRQSDWEFAKNEKGIEVFTRQSENTRFKEFKGITEMEISLHSVVALLSDVKSMPSWVSDCKSTELLSKTDKKVVYYMEISVPFPFSNRDMVQELTFHYDEETGKMEINLDQKNNAKDPVKGIVRMPVSIGKWTFDPVGEDTYKVVFQYLSDPGGGLPAWLVNAFLVKMPYNTLLNFREQVNSVPYKNAHFNWLDHSE